MGGVSLSQSFLNLTYLIYNLFWTIIVTKIKTKIMRFGDTALHASCVRLQTRDQLLKCFFFSLFMMSCKVFRLISLIGTIIFVMCGKFQFENAICHYQATLRHQWCQRFSRVSETHSLGDSDSNEGWFAYVLSELTKKLILRGSKGVEK